MLRLWLGGGARGFGGTPRRRNPPGGTPPACSPSGRPRGQPLSHAPTMSRAQVLGSAQLDVRISFATSVSRSWIPQAARTSRGRACRHSTRNCVEVVARRAALAERDCALLYSIACVAACFNCLAAWSRRGLSAVPGCICSWSTRPSRESARRATAPQIQGVKYGGSPAARGRHLSFCRSRTQDFNLRRDDAAEDETAE